MTPPNLGQSIIKVTTLNEREILLVQWSNSTPAQPLRWFIVPHPPHLEYKK